MTEHRPQPFQIESTLEGQQGLIPGVRPITQIDRLAVLMAAPLAPRREQKPLYFGRFHRNAYD